MIQRRKTATLALLILGLLCQGAQAAIKSAWRPYMQGFQGSAPPAFASQLGLGSLLQANSMLFAFVMDKTALKPSDLEGTGMRQSGQIRLAINQRLDRLYAEVDRLTDSPARERQALGALSLELANLKSLSTLAPKLMSLSTQKEVVSYQAKALNHYEQWVQAQDPDWGKGEMNSLPARAGRGSPQHTLGLIKADAPIATNPHFQEWLKTSKNPNAALAAKLAENLTWEQARLLDRQGGICYFAVKQGCEHCCLGCIVQAGDRRPIRQMSWEDFSDSVHALKGLQEALAVIGERPFHLISDKVVYPFYDSEPMSIQLPAKDGSRKTVVDVARLLYRNAGAASDIVTSGWNPQSPYAEKAAATLAKDIAAGKASYARTADDEDIMIFQIKQVSQRFQDEAQAFIVPILNADKGFQKEYGKEFDQFGFDFKKYPKNKGPPAYAAYEKIVGDHLNDFLAISGYMKDRMKNIQTLAPAFKKSEVGLSLYQATPDMPEASDPTVSFIAPWMTAQAMRKIQEFLGPFLKQLGPSLKETSRVWRYGEWSFTDPNMPRELGVPIALFNGTIGFSGASFERLSLKIPNMAAMNARSVQQLADNPILALNGQRPLWSVAADRLDGTRHLDITEPVRQSIAERILEISRGVMSVRVKDVPSQAVIFREGTRKKAWIAVEVRGKKYWFRFADGSLHEGDPAPLKRIFP